MYISLQIVPIIAVALRLGAAQTITAAFDCLPVGQYTLCQNLWNISSAVGSQSSTLIRTSAHDVSWSTNWTWSRVPSAVSSYANILAKNIYGKKLSDIKAIPSTWCWEYMHQSLDMRANVAYNIWLGNTPTGNAGSSSVVYEIAISLSELGGIHPAGTLNKTGISLEGHKWDLWYQPQHETWEILSFVTAEGDIHNLVADVNVFLKYLIKHNGLPASQYLQVIQGGNEAFTGAAHLKVHSFSAELI